MIRKTSGENIKENNYANPIYKSGNNISEEEVLNAIKSNFNNNRNITNEFNKQIHNSFLEKVNQLDSSKDGDVYE